MKQARKFGSGLLVLLFGMVLAGNTLLIQAADQTLEGTVSNTHCGLKHSASAADASGCVNGCVKNMGAKYALVVGDKVYELEGKAGDLEKLAGQKAKVTGTVDGMKVTVTSVAKAS